MTSRQWLAVTSRLLLQVKPIPSRPCKTRSFKSQQGWRDSTRHFRIAWQSSARKPLTWAPVKVESWPGAHLCHLCHVHHLSPLHSEKLKFWILLLHLCSGHSRKRDCGYSYTASMLFSNYKAQKFPNHSIIFISKDEHSVIYFIFM